MRACSLLAFFLVLTGCVIDDEPELGETAAEILSANKLAANKLAANKLSAGAVAAAGMSASALGASPLTATADGREVLGYIVSCALAAGDAVTFTRQGATYVLPGQIGLAPAWKTRAPTVSERRWVTACVLARTNAFGVSVQLSLRGPHPKLAAPLSEGLGYLLVEGAFYGDLFDATGPKLYACSAEVRDLDLALSTQQLRACAISTNGATTSCGFTYTGKCAVTDVSLAPACTALLPPYGKCRAGTALSSPKLDEVITVYLATAL